MFCEPQRLYSSTAAPRIILSYEVKPFLRVHVHMAFACVLSPRQQYVDKGSCMIDTALLLLLSVFCLKSFSNYEHQTEDAFPHTLFG